MSASDELLRRLERLEETVAFQDRTIEELGATVTDQWKQIEALRRELAKLGAELAELEAASTVPQREPSPPHY